MTDPSEICPYCLGSGEGRTDGATCRNCRGTGTHGEGERRKEKEAEEDNDRPVYARGAK